MYVCIMYVQPALTPPPPKIHLAAANYAKSKLVKPKKKAIWCMYVSGVRKRTRGEVEMKEWIQGYE